MPPRIHPTASLGRDVQLADDVTIGPACSLEGRISIGPGTSLIGHNYLRGPLTIGSHNRIYPFVCLGFEPQDYKFDPAKSGAGLAIGDHNILREYVSIHRATSDSVPTRLGNANMLMAGSHMGHDSSVADRCIFANAALVGGHARISDLVNLGGISGVAQHTHVGKLAFVAGTIGATHHVPPFMICRYIGTVGGINIVGLRRSGMSSAEIDRVRHAFRILYLDRNSRPEAVRRLESLAPDSPAIRTILDFLRDAPGSLSKLEPGKQSRAALSAAAAADEFDAR